MRVAIVGSRHFRGARASERVRQQLAHERIDRHGQRQRGDAATRKAALARGLNVQVMAASLDELTDAPRSAARNKRLVDACDILVAFWDGTSTGTRATVERALDSGKEVHVLVSKMKPE